MYKQVYGLIFIPAFSVLFLEASYSFPCPFSTTVLEQSIQLAIKLCCIMHCSKSSNVFYILAMNSVRRLWLPIAII